MATRSSLYQHGKGFNGDTGRALPGGSWQRSSKYSKYPKYTEEDPSVVGALLRRRDNCLQLSFVATEEGAEYDNNNGRWCRVGGDTYMTADNDVLRLQASGAMQAVVMVGDFDGKLYGAEYLSCCKFQTVSNLDRLTMIRIGIWCKPLVDKRVSFPRRGWSMCICDMCLSAPVALIRRAPL